MALLKELKNLFGSPIPDVYWIVGEIHILPLDGTATVTAFGFENEAAADTFKTIRTLKAKQDVEQRAWRVRRTSWENEHPTEEPFTEPEPFEDIPAMPQFVRGDMISIELGDYLELENTLKKQKLNLWATAYGLLKDERFGTQFEGARDA